MLADALHIAHEAGLAAGLVRGVLGLQEGGQRHLGVDHQHPAAGHAHYHVGPAAALGGVVGDLLLKIVVPLQPGHLQHVAQHLLAPAALNARAPAQGGGELARLELGLVGGPQHRLDLLLQAAGLLGAGLLGGDHLLLELAQRLGHGLQLGLHADLGLLLLGLEGLAGALDQLLGHGVGGLGRLGAQQLAGLGLTRLQHAGVGEGAGQIPVQRRGASALPPPSHDRQGHAQERQGREARQDRKQHRRLVHAPFL